LVTLLGHILRAVIWVIDVDVVTLSTWQPNGICLFGYSSLIRPTTDDTKREIEIER